MSSHKWFIEPLDAKTNEILAKSQPYISGDQTLDGVWFGDGKQHHVWVCTDYAFVAKLEKSKVDLLAVFLVWHQEGNGRVREWIFPKKKKPTFKQLAKKMRGAKMVNEKP